MAEPNGRAIARRTVTVGAPRPFPQHCQVVPQVLRGLEERCPLKVVFHHEIVVDGGIVARSASCEAHLFEAAAGLLKAIVQTGTDPARVLSVISFRIGMRPLEQEPPLGEPERQGFPDRSIDL